MYLRTNARRMKSRRVRIYLLRYEKVFPSLVSLSTEIRPYVNARRSPVRPAMKFISLGHLQVAYFTSIPSYIFLAIGLLEMLCRIVSEVFSRPLRRGKWRGARTCKRNSRMPIRTRRANLETDRLALIEIFRKYLTPKSDDARFEWLYCKGPHGVAQTWIAFDGSTGVLVGAASAFPRKVYVGSQEKTGLVLGDFCIAESYRSLGPSLQLQRACMTAIEEGPFEFFYDFPSTGMMAVYERLGIHKAGHLLRWAKPLRIAQKLRSRVGSERLARSLGAIGDRILERWGWKGNNLACDITLHQGLCGEEFTALDRQFRDRPGVRTVRSAEYLNWRYLVHPPARHEILAARRRGELIGYVVYSVEPRDTSVVDLCAPDEFPVVGLLLAEAVNRLRALGAETVSLNAGENHPWNLVFQRAGFRRREDSPVVTHVRAIASISAANFCQNWYLMRGDRDS